MRRFLDRLRRYFQAPVHHQLAEVQARLDRLEDAVVGRLEHDHQALKLRIDQAKDGQARALDEVIRRMDLNAAHARRQSAALAEQTDLIEQILRNQASSVHSAGHTS